VPVDHLFYVAIETLDDKCVTHGCGGGRYCPDQALNRAEAAVFLARTFDLEDTNACLPEAVPPEEGAGAGTDAGPVGSDAVGADAGGAPERAIVPDGAAPGARDGGAPGPAWGRGAEPIGDSPMDRGMTGGCQVSGVPPGAGWPGLLLLLIVPSWAWAGRRRSRAPYRRC